MGDVAVQDGALRARARRERVRRTAGLAVAGVAVLSLASALTRPFRQRLRGLLEVLPIQVPATAAVTMVFVAVALLLLARGLRHGSRVAWGAVVALLLTSVVLHLVKGLDVEEGVVALVLAGWLVRERSAFRVIPDADHVRAAAAASVAGTAVVAGAAALLVQRHHTGPRTAARSVVDGMFGVHEASRAWTSPLITALLLALGAAVLIMVGGSLTRPRPADRPERAEHLRRRERARWIVARHGADTLAYFALRDDKQWFLSGDAVVAYAVRDGVCMVSPDPVCAPSDRGRIWSDFTSFADGQGWQIAVLGAGEPWLGVYEAAGLRPAYLGDEAVVDCTAFSLDGRPMRGLRQACGRVARAGYTVTFHDPAALDEDVLEELRTLLPLSRRGEAERGFSMTLSRFGNPLDTGLLVSVSRGPDGVLAGFCQWVPAGDLDGWSLDVMRRNTAADLPNGVMDHLIVETIGHLRAAGARGLCLNFAVLRGVLAGERETGLVGDVQRLLVERFGGDTQIISLWRFNEKYAPAWRPRYAAFADLAAAPLQVLVLAGAEGITEIPLVGRLLGRSGGRVTTGASPRIAGTGSR